MAHGDADKANAPAVTTHVTRTYTTSDGGSAFEDLDVPLDIQNWIGALSEGTGVHEIVFRQTSGAYDLSWHTAPCRQFIIMINGGVDVTVTSGETRRFQDGDILLVEDVTGQGHKSKAVDGQMRKSILVKLRDDVTFLPKHETPGRQTASLAEHATDAVGTPPEHNGASAAATEASHDRQATDAVDEQLRHAEEEYRRRHPASLAQHQRAAEVMPGGNTRTSLFATPFPVTLSRGEGCRVWDRDGHEYLDGVGEFTAGIAGHSHPVLRAAVEKALAGGINLGGHSENELRFAQAIQERFPSMKLLRFTNSGTEANLMAVSAALAFTGRSKVLVFQGGYHGACFTFKHAGSNPVNAPFEFVVGRYNDCKAAEKVIQQHGAVLGAVVVEGLQGSGGCIPATPAFMHQLRRSTQEVGALLIMDEVMTSRLAPGGLQTELSVTPDLTTLGKYLGGGLSFGAFGGRADIMAAFDPREAGSIPHAGTFNNNSLTMAAGLAGMTQVYTQSALDALNTRGEALRAELNRICDHCQLQWTGRGSMMWPHFVRGAITCSSDADAADPRLKKLLFMHLNREGVWTNSGCMINLSLPWDDAGDASLIAAVQSFLSEHISV